MLCVLVVDDEEWIRLGIVSKLKKKPLKFPENTPVSKCRTGTGACIKRTS